MRKTTVGKKSGKKLPAEPDRMQINVRVSPRLLAALDKWRDRQLDSPSRPDAARRLLAKALKDEGEE